MKNFLFYIITVTFFSLGFNSINAQEKNLKKPQSENLGKSNSLKIGVVDMQKILNESIAYQGLVEQFEEIRRKHRNSITKEEDQIRDEENNLFKQKNIISKESYAKKVKELSEKINEIKSKKSGEVKKFELAFEKATIKIQRALVDVMSVIASKRELELVLAKSQVLLVGNDIDITNEAIGELNKVLPSVKFEK